MNWIISSLLMFASSVFLYLFVRKASLLKIPQQFSNLAMFAIPVPVYILVNFFTKQSFITTGYQLLILILLAFFTSYLGNVFSLKSIKHAPNPGYSLILSKSYVLFTTAVAVTIFHSVVTIKSAIAILLIIIFSAFIMIGKTISHANSHPKWIPLALGSFFCWGMLSIMSKYLFTTGLSVNNLLIYLTLFVSIIILAEMKIKKMRWDTVKNAQWTTLLFIGVFSSAFNYFMQLGLKLAPNIGYVNAINAASIAAVSVFSAILFKDDFSLRKIIGVFGVTAGLILLVT